MALTAIAKQLFVDMTVDRQDPSDHPATVKVLCRISWTQVSTTIFLASCGSVKVNTVDLLLYQGKGAKPIDPLRDLGPSMRY